MRSLSVTTIRRTSSKGALASTSSMRPRWPGVIQRPRRAAEDVAVLLAGQAHRRRVDDGQELLEVVDEHAVEEVLVAVLQGGQADVALERIAPCARCCRRRARACCSMRAHGVRQQALEPERGALLARERGALGVHRVAEERRPRQGTSSHAPRRGSRFHPKVSMKPPARANGLTDALQARGQRRTASSSPASRRRRASLATGWAQDEGFSRESVRNPPPRRVWGLYGDS